MWIWCKQKIWMAIAATALLGGAYASLPWKSLTSLRASSAPAHTQVNRRNFSSIRVGFDTRPRSFDPRLIGGDASSQYLEELLFLPLLSFDQKGDIRFVVASEARSSDGILWHIPLKAGVHFANGQELTAEDVVATLEAVRDGSASPPSPRRGALDNVLNVRVTGPYEISIELKHADAAFLTNLSIGILPKTLAFMPRDRDLPGGFESGPFLLTSVTDNEVILHRNSQFSWEHFTNQAVSVDEVRFVIIGDNHTRYLATLKGDLDILQNGLDADKLRALSERAPHLKIIQSPSLNTTYLGLKVTEAKLRNENTRYCIKNSIKKEIILKYSLQNLGEIAYSMFPKISNFHSENFSEKKESIFSENECKEIFRKAFGDHESLRIFVTTNRERIAVARAIAAQLKMAGLHTQVQALEAATFTDYLSKGLIESWVAPWTGFKDGDHLRYVFHSKMVPPRGGNRSHYSNSIVDSLLDKAQLITNLSQRKIYYNEAEKIIDLEVPYIYLWHRFNVTILGSKIENFLPYADGRYWSLIQARIKI